MHVARMHMSLQLVLVRRHACDTHAYVVQLVGIAYF